VHPLAQDEFRKREAELAKDKRNLKLILKEQVSQSVRSDNHTGTGSCSGAAL
jgi:hypothetical protein